MRPGESERRFRAFVSQDNDAFREAEKKKTEELKTGKDEVSFGARSLDYHLSTEGRVKKMEERIASGGSDAEASKKLIDKDRESAADSVRRSFDTLLSRLRYFPSLKEPIAQMLSEALLEGSVQEMWASAPPVTVDPEEFLKRLQEHSAPREVLVAILEKRRRRQEQLQKEWESTFEQWRGEFFIQVETAVADGIIPPNDKYAQRINDVRFLIADPIVMGNTVGRNHGQGVLSIQVELREETAIRKTVFHELTHHIAGGAIQRTDIEIYDHDVMRWKTTDYTNRKNGFHFNANNGFFDRGSWLNEGVTEILARHLAGVDEVTSYPVEQNAVWGIIRSGVPQKLLIDAYFEARLETPEDGSRLPAFRALNREMTKIYGAGWLKKIGEALERKYEELYARSE